MGETNHKKVLQDLYGYMRWGIKNGIEDGEMLANIAHDIGGTVREERCFSPRTDGYYDKVLRGRMTNG